MCVLGGVISFLVNVIVCVGRWLGLVVVVDWVVMC